jgi:hypothetical protein
VQAIQGQKAKPVSEKPFPAVEKPAGAPQAKSEKPLANKEVYTVSSGDGDVTVNMTIDQIVQVIRSGGLQSIRPVQAQPTNTPISPLPDQQANREEL